MTTRLNIPLQQQLTELQAINAVRGYHIDLLQRTVDVNAQTIGLQSDLIKELSRQVADLRSRVDRMEGASNDQE